VDVDRRKFKLYRCLATRWICQVTFILVRDMLNMFHILESCNEFARTPMGTPVDEKCIQEVCTHEVNETVYIHTSKRKQMIPHRWARRWKLQLEIPYILESNQQPFYSFSGLKNQMRIRIECGLDSRSRAGFWKNDRAGVRAVRTMQLFIILFIILYSILKYL
jgi:hypothetical protein